MSDQTSGAGLPIPQGTKDALADLEAQVKGLEAMIEGAKIAKMDTSIMQQTVDALKASIAALRNVPGAR